MTNPSGAHVILRAVLDVQWTRREGVAARQEHLSELFWGRIARETDRLLSEAEIRGVAARLDHLQVDLGQIEESRWEEELVRRFSSAFREALDRLRGTQTQAPPNGPATELHAHPRLRLVEHLLREGSLPWWSTEKLAGGVEELLGVPTEDDEFDLLRRMLEEAGRSETVRRRLVLQLSDEALHRLVRLLEPQEAGFIIGYVEELKSRHEREPVAKAGRREFRDSLWMLVLAHLLADRGSEFNRKEFVRDILEGLGRRFEMDYRMLLEELLQNPVAQDSHTSQPSFLRLLADLLQENRSLPLDAKDRPLPGKSFPYAANATPSGKTSAGADDSLRLLEQARGPIAMVESMSQEDASVVSLEAARDLNVGGSRAEPIATIAGESIGAALESAPADSQQARVQPGLLDGRSWEELARRLPPAVRDMLDQLHDTIPSESEHDSSSKTRWHQWLHQLDQSLQRGSYSGWSTGDLVKDLEKQLNLSHDVKQTIQRQALLGGVGRQKSIRERRVSSLSEKAVRRLVRLLEPQEAGFIIGSIEELEAIHKRAQIVDASRREFRDSLWTPALAHLVADRSSEFKRIDFLQDILLSLSRRFKVSHSGLLEELLRPPVPADSPKPQSSLHGILAGLLEQSRSLPSTSEHRLVPGSGSTSDSGASPLIAGSMTEPSPANAIQSTQPKRLPRRAIWQLRPRGSPTGRATHPPRWALVSLEDYILGRSRPAGDGRQLSSRAAEKQLLEWLITDRRTSRAWIRSLLKRPRIRARFHRTFSDSVLERVLDLQNAESARTLLTVMRLILHRTAMQTVQLVDATELRALVWDSALVAAGQRGLGSAGPLSTFLGRVGRRLGIGKVQLAAHLLSATRVLQQALPRRVRQSLVRLAAPPVANRGGGKAKPHPLAAANWQLLLRDPSAALRLIREFTLRGRVSRPAELATLPGGPEALLMRVLVRHPGRTARFLRDLWSSNTAREHWVARWSETATTSALLVVLPNTAGTVIPLARELTGSASHPGILPLSGAQLRWWVWTTALGMTHPSGLSAGTTQGFVREYLHRLGLPHRRSIKDLAQGLVGERADKAAPTDLARLLAPFLGFSAPVFPKTPQLPAPPLPEPPSKAHPPKEELSTAGLKRTSPQELRAWVEALLRRAAPDSAGSAAENFDHQWKEFASGRPGVGIALLRLLRSDNGLLKSWVEVLGLASVVRLASNRLSDSQSVSAYLEAFAAAGREIGWGDSFPLLCAQPVLGIALTSGAHSRGLGDLLRHLQSRIFNARGVTGAEESGVRSAIRRHLTARSASGWKRVDGWLAAASPAPIRGNRCAPTLGHANRSHPPSVEHLRVDLAARLRLWSEFVAHPSRQNATLLKAIWEAAGADAEFLYREGVPRSGLTQKHLAIAIASGGFDFLLFVLLDAAPAWRLELQRWLGFIEQSEILDALGFRAPRQFRTRIFLALQSKRRGTLRSVESPLPHLLEVLHQIGFLRRAMKASGFLTPEELKALLELPATVAIARLLYRALTKSPSKPPSAALAPLATLALLESEVAAPASRGRQVASEPQITRPPTRPPRLKPRPVSREPEPPKVGDTLFVTNAGLVLLSPYFPTYFTRCGLLESGKFTDATAAERGVHLLQHLLTVDENAFEHTLSLNKILCGIQVITPVPRQLELTPEERQTATELMDTAVQRWGNKGVTVEALRNSFLWRPGKLAKVDAGWKLVVEKRLYDILLTTVPWSYSVIRAPYMQELLYVEWT